MDIRPDKDSWPLFFSACENALSQALWSFTAYDSAYVIITLNQRNADNMGVWGWKTPKKKKDKDTMLKRRYAILNEALRIGYWDF